jgi:hypothetical protein
VKRAGKKRGGTKRGRTPPVHRAEMRKNPPAAAAADDAAIPRFCDFICPHAEFPPAETAGICRTMSAVYCGKLRELVNKNAPCAWRRRRAGPAACD